MTAYENKDFQILSNTTIQAALNHVATINRFGFSAQAIESTSVEALTEQLDQVAIAPNLFDTEQMSRLWSLLQGSYRPSIAYEEMQTRSQTQKTRKLASITALTAAMRYIPKSESFDRRGQGEKLYCVIAGSAVLANNYFLRI